MSKAALSLMHGQHTLDEVTNYYHGGHILGICNRVILQDQLGLKSQRNCIMSRLARWCTCIRHN